VTLEFGPVIFVKDLTLNVNGNIIIPDNFEKFKNLYFLSIYGSEDTKFEKVPNSIGQLSELEDLDIRYIPMEDFPYALTKLKKLKGLTLLMTKIKEIPNLQELISKITSLKTIIIDDIDEDDLKLLADFEMDYKKKT